MINHSIIRYYAAGLRSKFKYLYYIIKLEHSKPVIVSYMLPMLEHS